jgi:2-dehydro-3-deoxyglucarate aldolase/4-hydroxy-2-oxoheptanedioate aldolase
MTDTLHALAKRGLSTGTLVIEFATPGIGHILKHAGAEFVFLDTEHSGFSDETVKWVLQSCQAAGLPAIVRARSKSYTHVARLLDMGAEGMVVPMVGHAEEAAAFASWCRYPPEGLRGTAFAIAHDNYRGGSPIEKMRTANARVFVAALIETADGVANVEAIAAIPGIDCLWVGQFDLSTSLGIPAQWEHPRFRDAMRAICAAGQRHGKALGRLVLDRAEAAQAHADGFRMLAWGVDAGLLQQALAAGIAELRALG